MFLATLSHEMRTPLTAITGWVGILRIKGCKPEQLTVGLNVIDRSVKTQVQLIEGVLDVSRIVSGKLRMEMRPCDLLEVVKAGIDVARPAPDAREITLTVDLDPAAKAGLYDPVRIQQVVSNLVNNVLYQQLQKRVGL